MALSLTQRAINVGATAKYLNQEFDSRTRAIGDPNSPQVFRGWIMSDPKNKVGPLGKVRFMYNPPDITLTHTANPHIATGQAKSNKDVLSTFGSFGEMNLLLRFDRTYELWDGKNNSPAARDGVAHDVGSVYQILGISEQGSTEPSQPMVMAPIHVVLGSAMTDQRAQGPVAPGGTAPRASRFLSYYGVVTGLSVHYTSFNRLMVPRRAEVQLTMTLTTPALLPTLAEQTNGDSGYLGTLGGLGQQFSASDGAILDQYGNPTGGNILTGGIP